MKMREATLFHKIFEKVRNCAWKECLQHPAAFGKIEDRFERIAKNVEIVGLDQEIMRS
jgi:hypothetical protein